jgi:hypothetical protein
MLGYLYGKRRGGGGGVSVAYPSTETGCGGQRPPNVDQEYVCVGETVLRDVFSTELGIWFRFVKTSLGSPLSIRCINYTAYSLTQLS